MSPRKTEAGRPDRKVACRECRRPTGHEVMFEQTVTGEEEWIQWREEYRVVRCRGCEAIAFQRTLSDSDTYDEAGNVLERHDVYPRPTDRKPMADYEEMPWPLRVMYWQTLRAFSEHLSVLTAMGIRAVIEAMCNERGCKPARLIQKIDEMVSLGVIPQHHADLLHEIRFLGNDAAHEVNVFQPAELSDAIDAVEIVLRAVYVAPSVAGKMQERRARREARAKSRAEKHGE